MTGRMGATKKDNPHPAGPWETKDPLTCDLPRLQPIFNNQKTNKSSKRKEYKSSPRTRSSIQHGTSSCRHHGSLSSVLSKTGQLLNVFLCFPFENLIQKLASPFLPFQRYACSADVSQVVYSSYICESRM